MKMLLTSAGIKNTSIRDALVDLLGKPIEESNALCIPTASYGEEVVLRKPPAGGDEALGEVDFAIFPHVDHEDMPDNSMAEAERWAAGIPGRSYAIDDQTAIKVTDGSVEVISEGHWKLFPR